MRAEFSTFNWQTGDRMLCVTQTSNLVYSFILFVYELGLEHVSLFLVIPTLYLFLLSFDKPQNRDV